jgi:hypothetical protein
MPSIKIVLDTRRAKKDGSFPLILRIRNDNKYCDIATIYSLKENELNEKTQSIIGNRFSYFKWSEFKGNLHIRNILIFAS